MRNLRTLLILGCVTLAVVFAAYYSRHATEPIARSGEVLFPELLDQLNEVTAARITYQGQTATLERSDSGWRVKEKAGYPAAADQVRELALGLAQLRRLEPKTRNPDRYGELGLDNADSLDAKATHIALEDRNGQTLAALFVGLRRPGKGESRLSELFVLLPEDPQVWLAEGRLPNATATKDWLAREILQLDRQRIRSVTIRHEDGELIRIERKDPAALNYQLADLPENAEVESVYVVNSIPAAFADLDLDDVNSAAEVVFTDNPPWSAELTTFDGLVVNMATAKADAHTYARFSAWVDESLAMKPEQPTKGETASEPDNKPATPGSALKPLETVRSEAAELNARWQGWAYVLPDYRLSGLTKRKADLLKKAAASVSPAAEEPLKSGGGGGSMTPQKKPQKFKKNQRQRKHWN